ncbi:MAG: hypothetical protein V1690_03840 [Candidatus Moraniibacteriota bacterium]
MFGKKFDRVLDWLTSWLVVPLDWVGDYVGSHFYRTKKVLRTCSGDPYTLFLSAIKVYGMTGKVDLNRFLHFGELTWTLYGIVEKEGDPSPLTESFKKVFVTLAEREKKQWDSKGECYRFSYKIAHEPVTTEWIKKQDAAWRDHVRMFWLAYD